MKILRLMSRCNNRCIFCMVSDEIATTDDIPFEVIKEELNQLPEGTMVDLFGGEPTLYPHFFYLLAYLHKKGFPFQIASNGKMFKNSEFTKLLSQFNPLLVRTSIYGDNAQTHDSLTLTQGSFSDTLLGIQNMIAQDIPVSVNYVILATNYQEVLQSTINLMRLGVRSFKYSLPIRTEGFLHLLADIGTVRRYLLPTLSYLESNQLKFIIEKAPFCLAPQYIRNYFMENSDEMVQNLSNIFVKPNLCFECLLETYCHGVEAGYFKKHAEAGVEPLKLNDLPADFVKSVSFEELVNTNICSGFSLFHLTNEEALLQPENIDRFFRLYSAKRQGGCLIGLI